MNTEESKYKNFKIGDEFIYSPNDEKFHVGTGKIPCEIYGNCKYNTEIIFTITEINQDKITAVTDDDYLFPLSECLCIGANSGYYKYEWYPKICEYLKLVNDI